MARQPSSALTHTKPAHRRREEILSLRLTPPQLEALRSGAFQEDMTISQLVRRAIAEYLSRRQTDLWNTSVARET